MAGIFTSAVELSLEKYARKSCKTILYGTAGFRDTADVLEHVMYRMGLLAVLRSKFKKAAVGVMITASHNPEKDNGVKIVDPMGEMLESSWEELATDLANIEDHKLGQSLSDIAKRNDINVSNPALIFLGRDTRRSSTGLAKAVSAGVKVLGGDLRDYGVVTTPMVHYFVTCHNTNGGYGVPTEEGYYNKIVGAFNALVKMESVNGDYMPKIQFDGANGVGALKMKEISSRLDGHLNVAVNNDGSSGELNNQCGADFVKVNQKGPEGIKREPDARCVSVDGDADRVIYYYYDKGGVFHMLDGDKIATLFAMYFGDLVGKSGLQDLSLGIVQTAYANGSSTDYIKSLGIPVSCVSTGVKHLHHRALQFDIGVYFEANGHGTVVFSSKAREAAKKASNAAELQLAMDVINQTVGDALADLLMVEAILKLKGWSIDAWDKMYQDLPNRLVKVMVADRTAITTKDAERAVVTPQGLQMKIDQLVGQYERGRSFVRPSGTEDVVRVYAEADTIENANMLAYQVALAVHQMANGVGQPPVCPQ